MNPPSIPQSLPPLPKLNPLRLLLSEFTKFFSIANNQLYALLEDDEELHSLVHTIELVDQSNHRLEEIRIRQEQFAFSQFQLALDKGLQQRIKSLVPKVRRRKSPSRRTYPPSFSSWNSSRSRGSHGRDPSLVQRYVDLDDAWNVQNDAYVALWQDAINKQDDEQPDEVEVHWGPTDDKLTKENLTIVESEGTFTDPFIFQSRPLEQ